MKKTIVGNWKMNPIEIGEAEAILEEIVLAAGRFKKVITVVCPPFPFLEHLGSLTKRKLSLGAQDCFFEVRGAYTGEVSAEMLKKLGVKYVIVGHSERRALGESDELINRKVAAALAVGLKVILCVGEKSRDESGEYLNLIRNQLTSDLSKVRRASLKNLLIAYEPVWAIGKDALHPASPGDFLETSIFIKKILVEIFGRESGMKVSILYGGSVDAGNSGQFLTEGQADGLLVGRESLNPEGFIKILRIADGV